MNLFAEFRHVESKVILNSTTYELLSDMDMPDV